MKANMNREGVAKTEPFHGLYVAGSIHPMPDFPQFSSLTKGLNATILLLDIEKIKPLHIFKTNARCIPLHTIRKSKNGGLILACILPGNRSLFKTIKAQIFSNTGGYNRGGRLNFMAIIRP